MFEDYTIAQLLALRSLFAETAEQGDDTEKHADALLILQYIDEELTIRGRTKSA
jgi:hypothetical protein